MSPEMWETLRTEAYTLPVGPARVATMQRAVEAADAFGDEQIAAQVRLELVWEADQSGDPVTALTAYAWVRGRYDREPERFARFARNLDWQAKWMPELAIGHPSVPRARIEGLIADVERYHIAAGAGPRAALDLRLTLLTLCGDPDRELPAVLGKWRAAARAGLSDCESCERLEEAEAILAIGSDTSVDDALAVLEPVLSGSVSFCSTGPARPLAVAVPLLARSGRLDEARRCLRTASIAALDAGVAAAVPLADLAAAAAAAGLTSEAARLTRVALGVLGDLRSPLRQLLVCRALLRALPAIEASGIDALAVSGTPPPWLTARPARLPIATIRAALSAAATQWARDFDARNGNSYQSDLLALPAPVLPSLVTGPTAPNAGGPAPAHLSPASASSGPTAKAAPRPDLGPAPGDLVGFERWARASHEQFQFEAVRAAAVQLADDPATPIELRAAAVLVGILTDRRDGLLGAPGIPEPFGIRLEVWAIRDRDQAASVTAGDTLQEFERLARRAAELASVGPEDGRAVVALRAARAAAAHWATASGDIEAAVAAVAAMSHDEALATDAFVDLQRWAEVAWCAADLLSRPDSSGGGGDGGRDGGMGAEWLEGGRAALELHRDEWPGTAAVAAQAIAKLALVLHRPDVAATIAAAHLPAVEGLETAPARQTALALAVILADAHAAGGDLAAALEAQRRVVRVARDVGPAMAGHAIRGQARLLANLRRLDESIVAAAEAAAYMAEAGELVASAEILVEQARSEAATGDWRQVGITAALALGRLPQPSSAAPLRLALLALAAESSERTGSQEAAQRWLAAADAATAADTCPAGYRSAGARLTTQAAQADALFTQALAEADGAATERERAWYRALVRQRRAVHRLATDAAAAGRRRVRLGGGVGGGGPTDQCQPVPLDRRRRPAAGRR